MGGGPPSRASFDVKCRATENVEHGEDATTAEYSPPAHRCKRVYALYLEAEPLEEDADAVGASERSRKQQECFSGRVSRSVNGIQRRRHSLFGRVGQRFDRRQTRRLRSVAVARLSGACV
eukprot:3906318-Pleurochrysis_carterae.AAC.2